MPHSTTDERSQVEFEQQMRIATQRLVEELEDEVSREQVKTVMEEEAAEYVDARVKTFVPNLTYRHARDRLLKD